MCRTCTVLGQTTQVHVENAHGPGADNLFTKRTSSHIQSFLFGFHVLLKSIRFLLALQYDKTEIRTPTPSKYMYTHVYICAFACVCVCVRVRVCVYMCVHARACLGVGVLQKSSSLLRVYIIMFISIQRMHIHIFVSVEYTKHYRLSIN